jgi:Tfp pilus assembly protein PilF
LNDEERQTFNKFKENRLKVKEIKNNYGWWLYINAKEIHR